MGRATTKATGGYTVYWRTWTFLLVLTAIMLFLDTLPMPRTPFVVLMVAAMLLKVVLISGIFMHLRQESLDLVIAIGVCMLGCVVVLYALIAPDALRILAMSTG